LSDRSAAASAADSGVRQSETGPAAVSADPHRGTVDPHAAGGRRTCRFWNIPGGDIEDAVRRSALLDRLCRQIGRDPATITRSTVLPVSYEAPESTRKEVAAAIDGGFSHVILNLPAPYRPGLARWVADELLSP
jgi:hypothetical protein